MKYSIIIPSWNNFTYLFQCIQSILKHTIDFEIIVILNGCTDESENYLIGLALTHPNVFHIFIPDRCCFSKSVNLGFLASKGDYIIILNDDTIVTPAWTDNMVSSIKSSQDYFQISKIGIVGPVSNNAGGLQGIEHDNINLNDLDRDSIEHTKRYSGASLLSGFLSGFCMLILRDCFKDVGLWDENYKIGGFEDNDFCLKAYYKGWKCLIDRSTFIFHYGQTSLSRIGDPYTLRFRLNQLYFYEKFFNTSPQKLTVISRVHNGSAYLLPFLRNISSFADNLIMVCDRCTDDSENIIKSFDFPSIIINSFTTFDEKRDRQTLINTASSEGSDWILSLDVDEQLDESFTREKAQILMHPVNPEIQAYIFQFKNFWIGNDFYRTDGIFGHMTGLRMARVTPATKIRSPFELGLHCSHVPLTPFDYLRSVRFPILHYGYNTEDKRLAKHFFYTSIDKNPDPISVGPEGYNHLISKSVSVKQYQPGITLALAMIVKNEEINLFSLLSRYYHFFDEIVIVDTGSSDKPRRICDLFNAKYYSFQGRFDFSSARNYAKSKCVSSWILSLDCDEEIPVGDFPLLYDLLDNEPSAYLFEVANIMNDGSVGYSDNIRLIRNIPEIEWEGFVHENVSKSITNFKLSFGLAPFVIKHFGYLKPSEIQVHKSKLYESLLMRQIRAYPEEAIGYFHLAFFYFERGKTEKGIKNLEHTLELEPSFFLSQKELGLHYLQKSIKYFRDFARTVPDSHFFKPWSIKILDLLEQSLRLSPGKLF